jgi:hypothetical protein
MYREFQSFFFEAVRGIDLHPRNRKAARRLLAQCSPAPVPHIVQRVAQDRQKDFEY